MEQWLGCFQRVEVVQGLAPQHEIGHEACASDHVAPELVQLGRKELAPTDRPAGGKHDDQRREEPAHSSSIEMGEAETLLLDRVGDDTGDQETRDDEEYVDANEAAAKPAGKTVKGDDRQDGHATQAIDIGAIAAVNHGEGVLTRRPACRSDVFAPRMTFSDPAQDSGGRYRSP